MPQSRPAPTQHGPDPEWQDMEEPQSIEHSEAPQATERSEEREYEVEVIYRQRAIYRLHAPDREQAEQQALDRWQAGAESDVPGYDWCELEAVRAAMAPEPDRQRQDTELILRFLRERERLILRLGGDLFSPSMNDAISAAQVASDLGWMRPGPAGALPDIPRATEALEWLCRHHRVICYERPRVRAGERGEIRLYCTPEYLEQLSDELEATDRRQAV
jgi:hypothetical protein